MELQLRDATLDDLTEIVEIYNSTVPTRMVTADTEPVSVESKLSWFKSHTTGHRPLWIVENEVRDVIGWISFEPFSERLGYLRTAEISIYLKANVRSKGVGRKVLEQAIKSSAALGIQTLLAFIFAHNEPSLQLFRSLGFKEWGELQNIAILDGIERSTKILGLRIF